MTVLSSFFLMKKPSELPASPPSLIHCQAWACCHQMIRYYLPKLSWLSKHFLPFKDRSNFWRKQSFIDNSLYFLTHLIVLEKAGQGDECSYLVPLNNRTKFSIVQKKRSILAGPCGKNQLEKIVFPTSQKGGFHIWHKHRVPLQSDLCTPDDVFIASNKIK